MNIGRGVKDGIKLGIAAIGVAIGISLSPAITAGAVGLGLIITILRIIWDSLFTYKNWPEQR